MAKGQALIVGVSKPGPESTWSGQYLPGVAYDVQNMRRFLKDDCHFQVETLRDSEATHRSVIAKIRAAAESLKRRDFFVFVYSGHGGYRRDSNGDETDRQDELLLIHDAPIVDDELAELWCEFKSGVRILTLMDACHSGTMMRKAGSRSGAGEIVSSPGQPFLLGLPKLDGAPSRSAQSRSLKMKAKLIHISACMDQQTAADVGTGGAFTLALLEAMQRPPAADYHQLHAEIQRRLGARSQISELHDFGPGSSAFLKQAPFKIDELSEEQIAAAEQTLAKAKAAWGLRETRSRGAQPSAQGMILSRPPKHRLDLVLDGNSITDVRAKAYALGLFEGITPAGPAGAIDQLLGGIVGDFVARRMISARLGEVFVLPTGNLPIQSEMLLFVGMGQLDQFVSTPQEVQQFVAGNAIRTLIQLGIDEFATVMIGGGSGQPVQNTLANLVQGFVDGLRDADPGDRVRRVILCENDGERYAEMVDFIYAYARSASLDDIRLTIYERPAQVDTRLRPLLPATASESRSRMFLHVRHQPANDKEVDEDSYEAILLTPSGKATAIPSSQPFHPGDREALLRTVGSQSFDVAAFGADLANFALSDEFIETLGGPLAEGQHLIVVHDAESSKLPWETLRCGARTLALDGGISRKYLLSGDYSIAKWLERRRFDKTLDILLVVNPTGDLEGAQREGEIVRGLIKEVGRVKVTEIGGKAATHQRLLSEFRSGAYDVIHYAGHAGFDENDPSRSGILCSDHRVLSGSDLATVGELPALVFFNACESARIRKTPTTSTRLERSVSFAEAFLRGGIANFIGTYWPVGDDSAEAFANTFYGGIIEGQAIGDALIAGRRVVQQLGSFDWADYIHYGDPDFRVKQAGGNA
jgi:hypothetical protein